MTVNCNIAREWHAITSENKDYFSIEAYKNTSKHRKLRESCIFDTSKILINSANNNISEYEFTPPAIETINFSTRRYSSIT